jgi:hypothetical protein
MLEPYFAKNREEKFKHEITAQFCGINPIWTLSHCARDVGGMWMSATLSSVPPLCKYTCLSDGHADPVFHFP